MLHGRTIEIPHPDLAVEVRQREVDEQATVLAASVGPHAVVPAAGVTIKPREAEPVQRGAAPLGARLAVTLELDRPSLSHRVGVLLALTITSTVDHHVLRRTPVDTRRIG
jgi:zona occludens toxin (predicted ATPase)